MPQQTASVTVTGTPEEPIFNFVLPTGGKGEPGGWNVGTNLGTTDLDTLTTPGLYWNGSTANAMNPALHYPPMTDPLNQGTPRGTLQVQSWSGGTAVIQTYTRLGSGGDTITQRPRTIFQRYKSGSWSEWNIIAATRYVIENGIRVMQTWDDEANTWVSTGPGGSPDPAQLDPSIDLNTVTISGSYSNGVAATTAQNYPVSGVAGLLRVRRINGNVNLLEQEWTPFAHTQITVNWSRGTYVRMVNSGTWGPWRFIASQRVDDTAGRAIYTWDETTNREQLVYGDSGVRNIVSGISGQSTAASDPSVLIHRHGGLVNLYFENLQPAASGDWTPFNSLPAGFRPRLRNPHRFFVTATNLGEQRSMFIYTSGAMTIFGTKTTDVIRMALTYPTVDPWPTSLPGTAV